MTATRAVFACLWLGVACAAHHYEAKPLEARAPAEAFAARSLDDPELRALASPDGEAPGPWDFEALTRVALALRPELALARAEIAEARAAIVTAGARPNPSLAFTPEIVTDTSTPWILTWVLSFPFEVAGKRTLRVEAAEERLRAAEFRAPLAAWSVRVDVRRALDELAAARAEEALTGRVAELEERHLLLERARLAAGAIERGTLARAEQGRARAAVEQEEAGARRARALSALAVALALPRATLESAVIETEASAAWPEPPEPGPARELALVNRLDLRASLAEYAAADADLRLQLARQYPDVHLAPGYSYDQGDHKIQLGLTLELPLFDRNQGPIAEAEARRTSVGARFLVLEESVLGAVEGARVAYAEALANHGNRLRAEELAEAELRRLERALADGAVDRLAPLEAELLWLELGRARAAAEAEVARTRLALEESLQCPLAAEVAP